MLSQEKKKLLKQLAQMGEAVLVKDQNIKIDLNEKAEIPLQTQEDAVLYFLQRLDVNMLGLILEDNRTYQDFKKPFFLKELDTLFDKFLNAGDSYMNKYNGVCGAKICKNFKCKGYSFVGNITSNYFDLIIEVKDHIVTDIYECGDFDCDDFIVRRNKKIGIEFIFDDINDNLDYDDDDDEIPF